MFVDQQKYSVICIGGGDLPGQNAAPTPNSIMAYFSPRPALNGGDELRQLNFNAGANEWELTNSAGAVVQNF